MAMGSNIKPNNPPSETLSQMLFASYAQRLAASVGKRIVLFAPTQPEEDLLGYDANLNVDGCRELYIQFKRGRQSESETRFKVDNVSKGLNPGQLDTLNRHYPPMSAYYVAGGFWDVSSSLEAQNEIANDCDFLNIYAAVSAHAISFDKGTSQVCLGDYYESGSPLPKYDAHMVAGRRLTHGREWFYGCELFMDFLGIKHRSGSTYRSGATSIPAVGCSISRREDDSLERVPTDEARQIDTGRAGPFLITPGTAPSSMLTVRICDG